MEVKQQLNNSRTLLFFLLRWRNLVCRAAWKCHAELPKQTFFPQIELLRAHFPLHCLFVRGQARWYYSNRRRRKKMRGSLLACFSKRKKSISVHWCWWWVSTWKRGPGVAVVGRRWMSDSLTLPSITLCVSSHNSLLTGCGASCSRNEMATMWSSHNFIRELDLWVRRSLHSKST